MVNDNPGSVGNGRIDDIEVLRACAIGMVLGLHTAAILIPWGFAMDGPLYGLWSGVDLFLAISGFVIGRSLLPILPPPSRPAAFFNTALSFWVRRAWRLLPSAWLWLAIPLLGSVVFNRSGVLGTFRANLDASVAAFFYVANFHLAPILMRAPGSAVMHYWSLSLEEQFYLALPLAVFLARGRLPIVLVAIAASQFFVRRQGVWGDPLAEMTKSDALCLGVLLSIWSRSVEYRCKEPVLLGAPLARWLLLPAFLLAFTIVGSPMLGLPNHTVGLVAVMAAAIVWVASYDRDYLFPPGRLKRALCWLGGRSYAIYLIHMPALLATREFWFRVWPSVLQPGLHHKALLLATSLPLIAVLAELNFRFVEDPLRRRGARIAERIRRRHLHGSDAAAEQRA